MTTSERMLGFLQGQGFLPEVDSDNGNIIFKYQMNTFLFVNNDDDEGFFQLIMPGIYDVTEDNREMVLEALNKTNASYKVIKCSLIRDEVWVFFESLLDSTPEVEDIVPRALDMLQGARHRFYECMQ